MVDGENLLLNSVVRDYCSQASLLPDTEIYKICSGIEEGTLPEEHKLGAEQFARQLYGSFVKLFYGTRPKEYNYIPFLALASATLQNEHPGMSFEELFPAAQRMVDFDAGNTISESVKSEIRSRASPAKEILDGLEGLYSDQNTLLESITKVGFANCILDAMPFDSGCPKVRGWLYKKYLQTISGKENSAASTEVLSD